MPDSGELLDFMRAWRAEFTSAQATLQHQLSEIITRLARLEREVANLHVDFADLSSRLDALNLRVTRIERRLELHEAT
jgi:uncharacterized protein (UPF0335 family)